MSRWAECDLLAKRINEVKGEGTINKNQVYSKWADLDLIKGIKRKNPEAIDRALNCNWYGKSLGTNGRLLHNRDVPENQRLDDIGIMIWAFKKMGKGSLCCCDETN